MKIIFYLQVLGKAFFGGIGFRFSVRRDRKFIILYMKLEVFRRFEEGEKLIQIVRVLGLVIFIVVFIRVNKDKIRVNFQVVIFVSVIQFIRCRGVVMGYMERLLSLWIEEQKRQNLFVSILFIQDKVRRFFAQLQYEQGDGIQVEIFGVSNGWFVRFKMRYNVLLIDELVVVDVQVVVQYFLVLRIILEEGQYLLS